MNFPGFTPDALAFLREFALNNDPVWFKPRKAAYEALLRGPMVALVADLLTLSAAARLPVDGDAAKAVFRVNRDVRFARDKRPYKTHLGAAISRGGGRLGAGLVYVHVEPGGCFMAAGFYQPVPAQLEALRRAMHDDPARFLRVAAGLGAAGLPIQFGADALKRAPRGFEVPPDSPLEPFLRQRSLIVRHALDDAAMADQELPTRIMDRVIAARPLLELGWAALDAR